MKEVIILLLMGYNNEVSVPHIKQEIETFYNVTVHIKTTSLPSSAYYKPRNRYRADVILKDLYSNYKGKRVIALTSKDISTSVHGYADWGVLGLGSLTNKVCIVSTYRQKGKKLTERTVKVALHELGHSYSIEHCNSNDKCFMKDAKKTIKTIDNETKVMCSSCKSKKKV